MVFPNDNTRERPYLYRECKERYPADSCSSSVTKDVRTTDESQSQTKGTKGKCGISNNSNFNSKKKRFFEKESQKSRFNASKKQQVNETRSQTKSIRKLSTSRKRNSSTDREKSPSMRDLGSIEDSSKRWEVIRKKFMDIL